MWFKNPIYKFFNNCHLNNFRQRILKITRQINGRDKIQKYFLRHLEIFIFDTKIPQDEQTTNHREF